MADMESNDGVAFGALVGAELRDAREELRLSQDAVARAATAWGLNWSRTTVGWIETGRREVGTVELLLLPLVLRTANPSSKVTIREFLARLGPVSVTDGWVSGELLAMSAADGLPNDVPALMADVPITRTAMKRARDRVAEFRNLQLWWPGSRLSDVQAAADAVVGEADAQAARRLGVDPEVLSVLSFRLWGRTFTDEREARVATAADAGSSARSLQAIRGHVTRAMDKELAELVEGAS